MLDSGFVAHAQDTAEWVRAHSADLTLVVNTHWHSDHVGGNALLQSGGAGVAASDVDAEAVNRRDPKCCAAEYLDQPVAPYVVDETLQDGQVLKLGDADWQVVATPGHTPGHLCLWQPEERLLAVGDAMSDYDVGWVNLALDGPDAAATALASLQRLAELEPLVLIPAHGPIPTNTTAALAAARRRAERLVEDPDGAVWYALRRIFAFALMIYDGIPTAEVDAYLHRRAWLVDAARLLDTSVASLAEDLIRAMTQSGSVVARDGRLYAAAPHTSVQAGTLTGLLPRASPPLKRPHAAPATEQRDPSPARALDAAGRKRGGPGRGRHSSPKP